MEYSQNQCSSLTQLYYQISRAALLHVHACKGVSVIWIQISWLPGHKPLGSLWKPLKLLRTMFQTTKICRTCVTRSLQTVMSLHRHLSLFSSLLQQPFQLTVHHCHSVTVGKWGFNQTEKLFLVSWSWMRLFSASEVEEEMNVLPAAKTISSVVLYMLIALYYEN